jgi:hypothetical protein
LIHASIPFSASRLYVLSAAKCKRKLAMQSLVVELTKTVDWMFFRLKNCSRTMKVGTGGADDRVGCV